MEYNFRDIEKKWFSYWKENQTYKVTEDKNKKKFYVLNMFPYPSGAGLHVGHPLGYIASDIYARFKRLQGFNVLNPMGYDVSHSTGTERCAPVTLATISGHSGLSRRCITATSTRNCRRLSLLRSSSRSLSKLRNGRR